MPSTHKPPPAPKTLEERVSDIEADMEMRRLTWIGNQLDIATDVEALTKRVTALDVETKALRLLNQGLSSLLGMTNYNELARRVTAIETTLEPSGLLHIQRRLENLEAITDIFADQPNTENMP